MAAGTIADAFINVSLDPKQINSQLSALGGGLEGRFGKLGGGAGLAMKAGIVGAVAGTAILVGKELYQLGARFDEMKDSIQVATGATGKDLEGMADSAKRIATEVPASFEDAGEAIGQVRARTGLTGKALEGLTEQMLELSRITGTDVKQNIELATRTLGDWGFKGAAASEALDKIFRASQATGVGFDTLSSKVTKFGGPMRQLGFGFEETVGLLAKFEKEGVNTDLVMGSMRIALGKMAKAGKDPQKELARTVEAIKNAGSAGEANRLALELFGARAGPDMAAAIREGRFEVDELVATIGKGKGTIVGTGKDTADFAEQWLMFKNKVLVLVAPLAEKFFELMGEGMAWLNEELPPLIEKFEKDFGPTLAQIGQIVEDLMPVFKLVFGLAITMLRVVGEQVKGVVKIISGIVQVVSALLRGDWSEAWQGAKRVVEGLVQAITAIPLAILGMFGKLLAPLAAAAGKLGKAILDGILGALKGIGNAVRNAVSAALTFGGAIVGAIAARAAALGRRIISAIVGVVEGIGGLVRRAITAYLTFGAGLLGAIAGRARAIGGRIVSAIVNGLATVGAAVRRALSAGLTFGRDLLATIGEKAKAVGKAIVHGIWDGIRALAGWLRGKIEGWARDILPGFLEDRLLGKSGGGGGGGGGGGDFRSTGPTPVGAGVAALSGGGGGGGGLAGPAQPFPALRRQLARLPAADGGGAPGRVPATVVVNQHFKAPTLDRHREARYAYAATRAVFDG